MRSVREQEIVIAGKNVFHAGPARMNQQSRSHSAASRHTAERKTFLDVIRVAAPGGYAGRLLGRVIDEPSHLLRIQTCSATRCRRGSENSTDAVRTFMRLEDAGLQCHEHARPHVITQRDGSHEMHARDAELLADGKRRRYDIAAGMPARWP